MIGKQRKEGDKNYNWEIEEVRRQKNYEEMGEARRQNFFAKSGSLTCRGLSPAAIKEDTIPF